MYHDFMQVNDCDSRPSWRWPHAAYIHVPFCAHHCGYCDFAIAVGQDARIDEYIDALTLEMSSLGRPQPVQTLFIGGGTPTHLGVRQLETLLGRVLRWFPLLPNHEFSIEANPASLDSAKIRVLADHGVNRLSLGAQSFASQTLRVLERDHQPADVARAIDAARCHIDNISLDLIFGVPGQSLEDWLSDLHQALAQQPTHLATYGLTYEKGTPLWKQRRQGVVQALPEEAELALYTTAMDVLEAAGFEHHEISNFARHGYRCRHNHVYWANHAYFGFGQGAARYVEGVRQTTTRDFATYLKRVRAGQPTHFQSEELPPRERAFETIALQLRRADGIDRQAYEVQTGFSLMDLIGPAAARMAELELLTDDGSTLRLTRKGKCVADAVIAEIMKRQGDKETERHGDKR
jgi:oxygen-independent coproporphyrinogen-3 oxidase